PYNYLGWQIDDYTIKPKKLILLSPLKTLNDIQKFMGELQWIRPITGLTDEELAPL
ncbi:POK6 protein, partial [Eudromia elegans]|nr:POK6 protein [Eudromia elegans]